MSRTKYSALGVRATARKLGGRCDIQRFANAALHAIMRPMRRLGLLLLAPLFVASPTSADNSQCHVVAVNFVPTDQLQIVAWVETASGTFVDTVYLTNKVGLYGMGNRPGRFDFNSGPQSNNLWPYGRRITTFPVWAHRHGLSWPEVDFQDGQDNDLSHPFNNSSPEVTPPYCRPMNASTDSTWDAGTCASPGTVYTDKGVFSTTATSLYPPRADLIGDPGVDSPSVAMYKAMNPFDAVTQATPRGGEQAQMIWPIPSGLALGNYVLFVEVAKEYDFNGTYNSTVYPSPPGIPYGDYGVPYRGQPSIVYSVPFTIGTTEVMATTSSYAGYGDPTGATGTLNLPDSTITTDTPASGASRLEVLPGTSNLLLVDARPVTDTVPPGPIMNLAPAAGTITSNTANVTFIAPGGDGSTGQVSGYEVRIRANSPITDANFEGSMLVAATVTPAPAGSVQTIALTGLLPETNYYVGVRAFDQCHNLDAIATTQLTTGAPQNGQVDACFVATAAYGSLMANDVEMLRHFRDSALRTSALGELFVESYYTFGPPVAGVVGSSDLLRATARGVLDPIVGVVRGAKY